MTLRAHVAFKSILHEKRSEAQAVLPASIRVRFPPIPLAYVLPGLPWARITMLALSGFFSWKIGVLKGSLVISPDNTRGEGVLRCTLPLETFVMCP